MPGCHPAADETKADFGTKHMSKVKPEFDNYFIPSRDPVCKAADTAIIFIGLAFGLVGGIVLLIGGLS